MNLHVDIILNKWAALYQERVGRVTVEFDSRPDLLAAFLEPVIAKYGNSSYLFVTDAHDIDHCPFATSNRLRMTTTPVDALASSESPKEPR